MWNSGVSKSTFKVHTKYFTYKLKDTIFIQCWKCKSFVIYELVCSKAKKQKRNEKTHKKPPKKQKKQTNKANEKPRQLRPALNISITHTSLFLDNTFVYMRLECLATEILYPTHYNDVMMSTTRVSIVYSTVCWGQDQEKHKSSASLAFMRGIHRWPVNSPHKRPVTRKMFPFDDVIMNGSDDCSIAFCIKIEWKTIKSHLRFVSDWENNGNYMTTLSVKETLWIVHSYTCKIFFKLLSTSYNQNMYVLLIMSRHAGMLQIHSKNPQATTLPIMLELRY